MKRKAAAAGLKRMEGPTAGSDTNVLRALASEGPLGQSGLLRSAGLASRTTLSKSLQRLETNLFVTSEPVMAGLRGRPKLQYAVTTNGLIVALDQAPDLVSTKGLTTVAKANPHCLPEILGIWEQLAPNEKSLLLKALTMCLPDSAREAQYQGQETKRILKSHKQKVKRDTKSRREIKPLSEKMARFLESERKGIAENTRPDLALPSARVKLLQDLLLWVLRSHPRDIWKTMPPAVSELDKARLRTWAGVVSKMARGSETVRRLLETERLRHSHYYDYFTRIANG